MGEEQQLDVERELYPDVKQELHLDVEEELYRDMEDEQLFVTLPGIINSRMFTQCFVETHSTRNITSIVTVPSVLLLMMKTSQLR